LSAGSLLIERIFNIDGFGLLTIQSITDRDYPLVMGILTLDVVLIMLGNILSDYLRRADRSTRAFHLIHDPAHYSNVDQCIRMAVGRLQLGDLSAPIFKIPFLAGETIGWIISLLMAVGGSLWEWRRSRRGDEDRWNISPLTLKKLQRFRRIRRGYVSFLIILGLAGIASLDSLASGEARADGELPGASGVSPSSAMSFPAKLMARRPMPKRTIASCKRTAARLARATGC